MYNGYLCLTNTVVCDIYISHHTYLKVWIWKLWSNMWIFPELVAASLSSLLRNAHVQRWSSSDKQEHDCSYSVCVCVCVRAWVYYLMKARVLYVVGCHLLLPLDLHTDLKTNGTRHRRLVCSLFCKDARTHANTHRPTHAHTYTQLVCNDESLTAELKLNFGSMTTTEMLSPLKSVLISKTHTHRNVHTHTWMHYVSLYIDDIPKLYQTSISPLRVRTSMMLWPKKSSDSLFRRCFTRDLMSSSSSQTRNLIRSDELWHSLWRQGEQEGVGCSLNKCRSRRLRPKVC